jgi:hypothetical protein
VFVVTLPPPIPTETLPFTSKSPFDCWQVALSPTVVFVVNLTIKS